jgi:hypothetical protein
VLFSSTQLQELRTTESELWHQRHTANLKISQSEQQLLDHRETTQKGPDTPYLYATPEDVNSVAAQVHEDTTAEATSPDLTVRPAVLNISLVCNSLLYQLVVSEFQTV